MISVIVITIRKQPFPVPPETAAGIGFLRTERREPMSGNRNLICICLSQAHTFLKTDLVSELEICARKEGYGIVAFNSSLDYYWSHKGTNVTGCVYDLIRYDRMAAMVVLHDNIYDMPLLEKMIRTGNEQGIPVFYLGGKHKGCISIVDDYAESYKQIIRHVIRDHGARDTFFIGGLPDEDNSVLRLKCYREVLAECGLPCPEENIAYGDFIEPMAADIVRGLIRDRERLPRAIICANDSMAAAACDELKKHGVRVPEDVIVTGFDGTPTAYLVQPQLTTCSSNPSELAQQVLSLLKDFTAGKPLPKVCTHPYRPVLAESCGCPGFIHERFNALHTFRQAEALYNHENTIYYGVEQMLDMHDVHEILEKISALLLPDSALYLNRSFLETGLEHEYDSKILDSELIMIPYRAPETPLVFRKVYLKDMPLPSEGAGATIVNVVHSNTQVCGYYAACTEDLGADAQFIKRVSDVLNLVFAVQISRLRQRQLRANLENNLYLDPLTGLDNLRGLTRWFENACDDPANMHRSLALSVYSIQRFSYLYETYGMAEIESVQRLAAKYLKEANPRAAAIAKVSEDQYVVVDTAENPEGLAAPINEGTAEFFRRIESYNAESSRPYFLEISCGCTTLDRNWKSTTLENLVHLALGEMYLTRMRENRRTEVRKGEIPARMYSAFSLLMEKNLFRYHFQPIIDARSGLIYAYEALMRTDSLVGMDPLDILATAREYGRLYEVEKATVYGIMERYARNPEDFQGCRVFINTIPGHFLSEEDCKALRRQYGSFMDRIVFELTEADTATDEELKRIKSLGKPGVRMKIAIDDFGTGHSNILNLLRYAPNIIKIDRGLVSGITGDSNRQLFVRNTIDFAHQNGIKALAEGVETEEELRALIGYGIDLIQGFYTGRPTEQPLRAVSEKVRNEILEENLRLARYDSQAVLQVLKDGDSVNLVDLAIRKVTCLQAGSGSFTISGVKSQNVNMTLRVDDGAEAEITLNQVNMKGEVEPTIQLGRNSRVKLILVGQNTLTKEGIRVPGSASLTIAGEGQLHVNNNRNYSVGIGANYNDPYGSITLDAAGPVTIHSSGDKVACLGGGRSSGEGIRILRGTVKLSASGINVVGIGSASGKSDIRVENAAVEIHAEGNEALLIGSVTGESSIRLNGSIRLSSGCEQVTAVGTMNGTAEVAITGGTVDANIHCDIGAIIGTLDGEAKVLCRDTRLLLHGEGNRVAAIGSVTGACDSRMESGELRGVLLAGERMLLGNSNSRFTVTGGNLQIFQDASPPPVSPAGLPLHLLTPAEDHFEQTFRDRRETWTYVADRNEEGFLGVYVPVE